MTDLEKELIYALNVWLWYAEECLSEFDVEGDPDCDDEPLCPRCRPAGCIQWKIRRSRALIAEAQASPSPPLSAEER